MCKTLAEGGPCYSHKQKALQKIEAKHDEGLDQFARKAEAPRDEAKRSELKNAVTHELMRTKETLERELKKDLTKAKKIAARSKKNILFYNLSKQQSIIDAKSKELNIDRRVVEQALPILSELQHQDERAYKLSQKVYGRDMNYEGIDQAQERARELSIRLDAVYESNNVSHSDQEKLEGIDQVGKLTEKSFRHQNVLDEFREAKNRLEINNQKIMNLPKEQKESFSAIDVKKPISTSIKESYRDQYSQLPETRKLETRMAEAREEMKGTAGYINQAKEELSTSLRNNESPQKTQQMQDELDHLILKRAFKLGAARGLSAEASIEQYPDKHFDDNGKNRLMEQIKTIKL